MLDRVTAKAVLHRYQTGWLGSDHHFKIGTQIERGEHRLRQSFPGGVQFVDSNGAPSEAIFRAPSIAGGVFITTGGVCQRLIQRHEPNHGGCRRAVRSQSRHQPGPSHRRRGGTRDRRA